MSQQVMDSLMNFRSAIFAVGGLGAFAGLNATYVAKFRKNEKKKSFNAYTIAEEAINGKDLTGKVAVVTGCNSGIGKETVRVLVKQGCTVVMACRTPKKAEAAKEDLIKTLGATTDEEKKESDGKSVAERLILIQLDLSSLQSVLDFATEFKKKAMHIDYLINNAGIMALPEYRETKDGFEMQFGTNHLGHWYLTQLLLPFLKEGKEKSGEKARVINLASWGHQFAPYDRVDPLFDYCIEKKCFMGDRKEEYNDFYNYGISKMANILHVRGLNKRYSDDIIPVCLHPGFINETNLADSMDPKSALHFVPQMMDVAFLCWEMKNIPQGAATSVRCVAMTEEEIHPGGYYVNCSFSDHLLMKAARKDLENGTLTEKLWKLSEELVKAKEFPLELQ